MKPRSRCEHLISGARVIHKNLKSWRDNPMAVQSMSYRCSCFKLCFGSCLSQTLLQALLWIVLTHQSWVGSGVIASCQPQLALPILARSDYKTESDDVVLRRSAFCSCLRLCLNHIDFYWTFCCTWDEFSNWGIEIIVCVVFIRVAQRDRLLLYCSFFAIDNASWRANTLHQCLQHDSWSSAIHSSCSSRRIQDPSGWPAAVCTAFALLRVTAEKDMHCIGMYLEKRLLFIQQRFLSKLDIISIRPH